MLFVWSISTAAFLITLIVWIINKKNNRVGRITGKVPLILLAISIIAFMIGSLTTPSNTPSKSGDSHSSSTHKVNTINPKKSPSR